MKNIAYIDVESTGVDTVRDAIFSFGLYVPSLDIRFERLIKPWKPIPPEVEKLTGTTNEMVANCPPFSKVAYDIDVELQKYDWAGFNIRGFDVPIIFEEMARSGIIMDLSKVNIIDHGVIFKIREKRDLSHAVQFYCGVNHEGAHGAMADCFGTHMVAVGQMIKYPDMFKLTREELAKSSEFEEPKRLSFDGKIIEGPDGEAIYNCGKYYGTETKVRSDIGYAEWMMKSDFPAQTKVVLGQLLAKYSDESAKRRTTQKALL